MSWPRVHFLETCDDVSGGNAKTPLTEVTSDGSLPIVDQGASPIAGYVNELARIHKSDLPVIVFGDHTRRLKFVDFPFGMGADGVKVLKARKGVDAKFLFRYLESVQIPSNGYSRHFKFLKEIEVPLPPLADQCRIAAILDRADTLRAKRRESMRILETIVSSTYNEMFGAQSEFGLPGSMVPLGELVTFRSGKFLPAKAMAEAGKFPVFGGNGVNGYHDEYMFEDRQIVLGRVGAYCGCVHLTPVRSWVTDNALVVAPNVEDLDLDFLAIALTQAELNQYSSQSGQPLISGSRIGKVMVPVPPIDIQHAFAARIERVGSLRAANRAHLAELDALFASLQHRAFSGER